MRTVATGAVALSAVAFAGAAEGATVKELFFQNGAPADIVLSDEDREDVIQRDGNDTLDVGDSIFGIIAIDQIFVTTDEGTTEDDLGTDENNELTAVFQIRVTDKEDLGGGNFNFTFSADEEFVADQGVVDGTVAVFFEDDSPDLTNEIDEGTTADQIARAVNGELFWTVGFTGEGVEFFTAIGSDQVADTDEISAATSIANANFSLNRSSSAGTAGDLMLVRNDQFGTEFIGSSNIRGTDGIDTDFDFTSNAQFAFTVIPTPAAAASGLLLLGLMGATRRGRRQRA